MTSPNRPPSCDLLTEDKKPKPYREPCCKCGSADIYLRHYYPEQDTNGWGPSKDRLSSEWVDRSNEYYQKALKECLVHKCRACGYRWDSDPMGENSIPRRSEVVELLWLVDEVTGWDDGLINQEEFDDGITMVGDIENLRNHANKLRKEWGLL